jgi:hypothetical protein
VQVSKCVELVIEHEVKEVITAERLARVVVNDHMLVGTPFNERERESGGVDHVY